MLTGNSTFTGNVELNQGTVRLFGATATIGTPAAASTFAVRQETTFDINAANASNTTTIGGLNGAGVITNGGGNITGTGTTAGTLSIGSATTTAVGYFTGLIQNGTGVLHLTKNGTAASIQEFTNNNTFTGTVTLIGGTLGVTTLADIGVNSGIGRGISTNDTTNAASLVFNGGTLAYIGSSATVYRPTQTPSVSINRLFTLAGNGSIDSSGSFGDNARNARVANNAALVFNNSAAVAFTGSGDRTLTLLGDSTGDNTMGLQLVNNTAGSGVFNLTKTGTGLWMLGHASNNYTGLTTVSNGTLQATPGSTLPASSPLVLGTSTTPAVLQMTGSFTRTLAATATAGSGTVTLGGTSTAGGGGFAASTGTLTVNLNNDGSTMVWGSTPGFVPTAAALVLNSTTALGEANFTNPIDTNGANRTIIVNDNTTTTTDLANLSGVISGTGGIIKTGPGHLMITGANTYSGDTEVQGDAGGVAMVTISSFGGTGITASNIGGPAGSLRLGSAASNAFLNYIGPGEVTDRLVNIITATQNTIIEANGAGPLVLTNFTITGSGIKTIFLRGANTGTNEIRSTIADVGGATSITKDGAGNWIFSNTSNSYTGTTNLNGGSTGIAGGSGVFGTGLLSFGNSTVYAVSSDRSISNAARINNATTAFSGEFALTFTGTFLNNGGNSNIDNFLPSGKLLTFTGVISLQETTTNRTLNVRGTGVTTFTNTITNGGTAVGSLNVNATTGMLILANPVSDNIYTGTTTVTQGTLKLGAAEQIPHGATFGNFVMSPIVATTATFDLGGFSETINGLTATGAGTTVITNSVATPVTLNFGNNDVAGTFGSGTPGALYSITNVGGGPISLVKSGSATVTFTGNTTLSHSGSTTVNAGSLFLNAPLTASGSLATTSTAILNITQPVTFSGTPTISATGTSQLIIGAGVTNPVLVTDVTVQGGSTLGLIGAAAGLTPTNLTISTGTGPAIINLALADQDSTSSHILASNATVTSTNVTINISGLPGLGLGLPYVYSLIAATTTGDLLNGGLTTYLATVPAGVTANLIQTSTLISLNVTAVAGNTRYWTGSQATASWSTVNAGPLTNWASDPSGATNSTDTPGFVTTVIFSGAIATGPAISTTLDGSYTIRDIQFTASPSGVTSVTIAPGIPANSTLTIAPSTSATGITVDASAGAITISAPVGLGANQTWNVNGTAPSSLLLSGGVIGSNRIVSKTGAGVATLSASSLGNLVGGTMSVDGGVLAISNVNALGGINGMTVSLNTGGTFAFSSATASTTPNTLVFNGGTLSAAGATQTYNAASTIPVNSFVVTNDAVTPGTARNVTLTGVLSGTGRLILDGLTTVSSGNQVGGAGIFILSNANNITAWSGGIQLNRGTIQTAIPGSFGSGPITANYGRTILQGTNGFTHTYTNPYTLNANTDPIHYYEFNLINVSPAPDDVFTVLQTGKITLAGTNVPTFRTFQNTAFTQPKFSGGIELAANAVFMTGSSISNYGAPPVIIETVGISESGGSRVLSFNTDTVWGNNLPQNVRINATGTYTGGTIIGTSAVTLINPRIILGIKDALGTGPITFVAGFIQPGVDLSGTNAVTNTVVLAGNGTVDGANNLTLSGTFTNSLGNRTLTNSLTASLLTLAGNVYLSEDIATSRTLTLGGTGSTTVSATIADANGVGLAGSLIKTGTGTLTLTVANNYSGTTTLTAGVLLDGNKDAFGTSVLTLNAGTLRASTDLSGANAIPNTTVVTANSIIDGSNNITLAGTFTNSGGNRTLTNNLTAGLLELAGNVFLSETTATARTLTLGGTGNTTVSATIADANGVGLAGSLIKTGTGTLTLPVANSYSGTTTLTAGVLLDGNKDAFGTSVLTLNAGTLRASTDLSGANAIPNTTVVTANSIIDGSNNITLAGTFTNSGGNRTLTNSVTAGLLTLAGNVFLSEAVGTARTITFAGAGNTTVNAPIANANGVGLAGGVIKSGTGTLTYGIANTYTGSTSINDGVLLLASGINQSLTGNLQFGSANTITTVGTFNMADADATFGGFVAQTNSTSANSIITAANRTLTINGNFISGGSLAASETNLAISGGGKLVVTNLSAAAFFQVGGNSSNKANLNLSGLAEITVSLNTTDGAFTVNPVFATNTTDKYSVLTLPPKSTLTAAILNIGNNSTGNNTAGQVNQMIMGSDVTTLNFNTINIGSNNRDLGQLYFAGSGGSVKIRSASDTVNGKATFNFGNASTTGVGGTVADNLFNVSGHNADIKFAAVTMGVTNRGNAETNVLSFNQGTLTMDSLSMSSRTSETANGGGSPRATTSTVNLGGGALDTIDITNGILNMASVTGASYLVANISVTQNATLNLTGGVITIGNTAGVSINNMANVNVTTSTAAVTANAAVNISGATVTVTGHILRGLSTGGTGTATLSLTSGTLEMSGQDIGATGLPLDSITFSGGTLRNLGNVFENLTQTGGTFERTVAGTTTVNGILAVSGSSSIVRITVSAGILNAAGGTTIATGSTLKGIGTVQGNVGIAGGGIVSPGNSPGKLSFDGSAVTLSTAAVYSFEINASGIPSTLFNDGTSTNAGSSQIAVLNAGTFSADAMVLRIVESGGFSGFDATKPYSWTVVTVAGGNSNLTFTGTPVIDTGNATLLATALAGGATLTLDNSNTGLINLNFTPVVVPEPSLLFVIGLLATVAVRFRLRN
ncbi:autotransporter-associated beta strand repeat-containing protein [soil metagenome]